MPSAAGGSEVALSIQDTIKQEMRQVLTEMSANSRKEEDGGGWTRGGRPADEMAMLKERIMTLEDALSKSEADRGAVYAKHEATTRALNEVNEEKMNLMREFHDNHAGLQAAHVHQQETESLRAQMRTMGQQYEQQIAALNHRLQQKDVEVQKLKRAAKSREDKVDGVSLADLHYSNERLSAQLAKLQSPTQPAYDEQKVAACESAVSSVSSELVALEGRMKQQVNQHVAERQQLIERMETMRREFEVERTECDKVMSIMSAKLEALISENNFLRSQVSAAAQSATASPRYRQQSNGVSTPGRRLYN